MPTIKGQVEFVIARMNEIFLENSEMLDKDGKLPLGKHEQFLFNRIEFQSLAYAFWPDIADFLLVHSKSLKEGTNAEGKNKEEAT